ncbi:UPF0223 family protein [Lactococcus formosensis]|uniref:UPF0223 protein NF708_01845 n=1 Tax=Lactococcus formosensis TaxID=1281486 RepID=A0A9X4P2U9_9LACT|nr:UPF0223 family protein [Lactococcus formosensis]MCH1722888.1 UPF0223 family protein [Lactococcus formosensis]MCO7179685.1 UPF0223 family protein [Lactococcus formosensis]MDG6110776.1 UPF0223 family protein [Lactococcus formosensis]MDG6112962.1 UPF0223 family protein [Lactococcus formosensis]MDG6115028.1 UPF0223 family protein [Lactococcus formosensis]
MKANYQYPLDLSWSTAEMTAVLSFFNQVENFYESKVNKEEFLESYKAFKKIVPSKMQEKQLGREFEENSGYSLYRAVKEVQASERQFVRSEKA